MVPRDKRRFSFAGVFGELLIDRRIGSAPSVAAGSTTGIEFRTTLTENFREDIE